MAERFGRSTDSNKSSMFKASSVLIVSAKNEDRNELATAISKYGLRSICCGTLAAAKALIARQKFGLVLCEDLLPDGDFRAVIGEAALRAEKLPVIIVSRQNGWDSYLTAMRAGAFDYVAFPPIPGELERILWVALSEPRPSREVIVEPAA